MRLAFTKMQGCGNDYIYFNCFKQQIKNPEKLSIQLSDRHFGIGGDGIILIEPSEIADAKMRIFNADGSEAKMCGNGIRCVGRYLYDHHMVLGEKLTVETLSGVKQLTIQKEEQGLSKVSVDMGAPILEAKYIPVKSEEDQMIDKPIQVREQVYQITCVSMGNPHCVVFEEDLENLSLETIGPYFEKHPLFPEQVNTEFIKVIDAHTLAMRVWERGSGETFACGTGACASVVAAVLNGYCPMNEAVTVRLKGGTLIIRYTEETVYMIGDAEIVFEGEVESHENE